MRFGEVGRIGGDVRVTNLAFRGGEIRDLRLRQADRVLQFVLTRADRALYEAKPLYRAVDGRNGGLGVGAAARYGGSGYVVACRRKSAAGCRVVSGEAVCTLERDAGASRVLDRIHSEARGLRVDLRDRAGESISGCKSYAGGTGTRFEFESLSSTRVSRLAINDVVRGVLGGTRSG